MSFVVVNATGENPEPTTTTGQPITLTNYKYLQTGKEQATDLTHNQCIVNIFVPPNETAPKTFTIFINMDRSGSMSSRVGNMTILQHAQHTLKNIINYFASPENYPGTTFRIVINHFDNENSIVMLDGEVLIELNETTAPQLIEKINNVEPRGTTNISDACLKAHEILSPVDVGPAVHILLTDGCPTAGVRTAKGISKTLPVASDTPSNPYDNVFFGFGVDHDDRLLREIAGSVRGGEYAFVDNIENAGIVYAEFMSRILDRQATDLVVHTSDNCEVYADHQWQHTYRVPSVASNTTKTLYLRHLWDNVEPIKLTLTYTPHSFENNGKETDEPAKTEFTYTDYNTTKPVEVDDRDPEVVKQFFAVKVMELIHEALHPKKLKPMRQMI